MKNLKESDSPKPGYFLLQSEFLQFDEIPLGIFHLWDLQKPEYLQKN